ncbi:MAG: hypothetical protein LC798_05370 [Chloroflexi bacterium]|nr:hypothetical protein [Chloroflexota bacterium]
MSYKGRDHRADIRRAAPVARVFGGATDETPRPAPADRVVRLDRIAEMETIKRGGVLPATLTHRLDQHRRSHTVELGVPSCYWCRALSADAAVDRSRYVQG